MRRKKVLVRFLQNFFKILRDNALFLGNCLLCEFLAGKEFLSIIFQDFCKEHSVYKIYYNIYNLGKKIYKNKLLSKNLARKTISARILQVSQFLQESARMMQDVIFSSSRVQTFFLSPLEVFGCFIQKNKSTFEKLHFYIISIIQI